MLRSLALLLLSCLLLSGEEFAPFRQKSPDQIARELREAQWFGHQRMSAHKANYFLLFDHNHAPQLEDQSQTAVHFQVSLKFFLAEPLGTPLFFGYTQKSWWQLYDSKGSRPFRESNYNPELFFTQSLGDIPYLREVRYGYEHESNGGGLGESRSRDQVFGRLFARWGRLDGDLKLWYRVIREAADPEMPYEDNPDIDDYYGRSALTLSYPLSPVLSVGGMVRGSVRSGHGAARLDLIWRKKSVAYYLRHWNGYGESLEGYNVYTRKTGLGVAFTWGQAR